jgi:hypothetical protein
MKHDQQTVEQIDAARRQYFERSPDRAQGRVRTRSRQTEELKKAKSRLRTAAWRSQLDKLGRPETDQVAVQFLVCLIDIARENGHAVDDLPETKAAFDRLFSVMTVRGFRRGEVEAVVKRMTRRIR